MFITTSDSFNFTFIILDCKLSKDKTSSVSKFTSLDICLKYSSFKDSSHGSNPSFANGVIDNSSFLTKCIFPNFLVSLYLNSSRLFKVNIT